MWQFSKPPNPPPYLPEVTWLHPPINKVMPWGEFLSSDHNQKLNVYPMYLSNNADPLWLVVWGPDCLLQPSIEVHQIKSNFWGRGSSIIPSCNVTPWGKFLSSNHGQKLNVYPMYLSNDSGSLWLDVWGPDCLLQPSIEVHQIKFKFWGRGSSIIPSCKVTPWGEFLSSDHGQKLNVNPMYLFHDADLLWLDVWGPDCLLQPSIEVH